MFVDSFGLNRGRPLAFYPDDQLMDIYRACHPVRGMPDAFEFESFALELEEAYGIDLGACWRADTTLGDVFAWTRATPQ